MGKGCIGDASNFRLFLFPFTRRCFVTTIFALCYWPLLRLRGARIVYGLQLPHNQLPHSAAAEFLCIRHMHIAFRRGGIPPTTRHAAHSPRVSRVLDCSGDCAAR